jgi:hypothetical protein
LRNYGAIRKYISKLYIELGSDDGDQVVKRVNVKDLEVAEENSYSQHILYPAPALT